MDLTIYYDVISSESKARKYLLGKCFKNHQRFCPRCRQRKLYKLRDERFRCSRCEYTFHDFSGRWINHGHLTCVQWLSLLKFFELEISVRKMAQQMKLSYRAAYGAIGAIRMAILSHAADAAVLLGGEIELDESYFGGRRKGNRGRRQSPCIRHPGEERHRPGWCGSECYGQEPCWGLPSKRSAEGASSTPTSSGVTTASCSADTGI